MNNDQVTIYHNPQCGTSRNTLALIAPAESRLGREYLKEAAGSGTIAWWPKVQVRCVDAADKGTPYRISALDSPKLRAGSYSAYPAASILLNAHRGESKGVGMCRTLGNCGASACSSARPQIVKGDMRGAGESITSAGQQYARHGSRRMARDLGKTAASFWYHALGPPHRGHGGYERLGENICALRAWRSGRAPPRSRRTCRHDVRRAYEQGAPGWRSTGTRRILTECGFSSQHAHRPRLKIATRRPAAGHRQYRVMTRSSRCNGRCRVRRPGGVRGAGAGDAVDQAARNRIIAVGRGGPSQPPAESGGPCADLLIAACVIGAAVRSRSRTGVDDAARATTETGNGLHRSPWASRGSPLSRSKGQCESCRGLLCRLAPTAARRPRRLVIDGVMLSALREQVFASMRNRQSLWSYAAGSA